MNWHDFPVNPFYHKSSLVLNEWVWAMFERLLHPNDCSCSNVHDFKKFQCLYHCVWTYSNITGDNFVLIFFMKCLVKDGH